MNNEHLLQVKDLAVSFHTYAGEVQAVRGVSWYLDKKETIAIVGESGCGKTVSIQTTMGLLQKPAGQIKEGSILFEGKEIIDCLEFGSASAAMLVASHACSQDMPSVKQVEEFIAAEKAEYGEMVARA